MKGREPLFVPCTPLGCLELLDRAGVALRGARAVVVGRSNIVGMPVALLLLKRDATVTVVHSRTLDPASIVRQADVVIAAAGQAVSGGGGRVYRKQFVGLLPSPHSPGTRPQTRQAMIKADWLKPGCAVIDVGTNPVDDPSKKAGYRLVGDVDYDAAKGVASIITPVPGGVGPMTIAMLLRNTLTAASRVG